MEKSFDKLTTEDDELSDDFNMSEEQRRKEKRIRVYTRRIREQEKFQRRLEHIGAKTIKELQAETNTFFDSEGFHDNSASPWRQDEDEHERILDTFYKLRVSDTRTKADKPWTTVRRMKNKKEEDERIFGKYYKFTDKGRAEAAKREKEKNEPMVIEPYECEELDRQRALSLSLSDRKCNENYFAYFLSALDTKNLPNILDIYEAAEAYPDAQMLIVSRLDNIPWRISCEYYAEEENIHWMNCWIKIGWWDDDEYELSPELSLDKWKVSDLPIGIHNSAFRAVVWEGRSAKMLLDLMKAQKSFNKSTIPVELEYKDDFWVPVSVDVKREKDVSPAITTIRFAKIEIGELNGARDFDLDKMRTLKKETILGPREKLRFYHGCNIGEYLVEDDDVEYNLDLVEWEDDDYDI